MPLPPQPLPAPEPTPLAVLTQLDLLAAQAPPAASRFAACLAEIGGRLNWRQTYRRPDVSEAFLRNYGWTELIGPRGAHRDPSVSIGLLLLGPDTHYPLHHHAATERYVPLSGEAEWFDEDHGWRPVAPLETILHRSMIGHAMQTRDQPLLAFFHWSGEGIDASARLS
jgi:hypothetical protein